MRYQIESVGCPIAIDGDWTKTVWRDVEAIELTHHLSDRPEHFPNVRAKLRYDEAHLYVIFRVEDRYVRAVAKKHQGMVCEDSCVEFFFTPGTDVSKGYFNLEANCGGTILFHYQLVPRQSPVELAEEHLRRIEIAHSMPKIVDPEIAKPTTWTVEYRLPVEILCGYFPADIQRPTPGAAWRVNFFKCADKTSHPHWLSWAKVNSPQLDFHKPEFFGTLEFK